LYRGATPETYLLALRSPSRNSRVSPYLNHRHVEQEARLAGFSGISLQHDPEKWVPVFRKIMLKQSWSGMAMQREAIPAPAKAGSVE
jgi:hypothetical protein